MIIYITGPNGILGNALSLYLLKKNFKLVLITSNKKKIYRKFKNYLHLIKILKYKNLKNIKFKTSKKKNLFIHLAGASNNFFRTYKDLYEANVVTTHKVLNFCIKNKISNFYLLSSLSVYSHKNKSIIHKKLSKKPTTNYGRTKLKAENLALNICNKNRISLTIIRIPSVYGAYTKGKSRLLRSLINFNIPLPVKGIKLKRSYLSIDYFMSSILRLIKMKKKLSQIFITDQNDLTLNELVDKLNFNSKKIYKYNLIKYLPNFMKNCLLNFRSIRKLIILKNEKF